MKRAILTVGGSSRERRGDAAVDVEQVARALARACGGREVQDGELAQALRAGHDLDRAIAYGAAAGVLEPLQAPGVELRVIAAD
jgi:hypothetical protein